jgi:hypothetical protein
VARDSLFGEQIVWSGRPKGFSLPAPLKVVALASAVVSASTLCFAVACAMVLEARVSGMVAFAAWCAMIALAAFSLPRAWREGVEYLVTEKHVIWRRGRFRRTIERSEISYARIRWNPGVPGVGDLAIERAVPTGALRRTLSVTLADVEAPDRLWAIVRGVEPSAPLGDGDRSLAQRLDAGERVLWSGTPVLPPWPTRRIATACVAATLGVACVRMITHAAHPIRKLAHALPTASLVLLVAGVALAALLLAAVALFGAYAAWVRPVRLAMATRYFVTDRRVLIRRGHEELHLDRSRIADVIVTPASGARPPAGAHLRSRGVTEDGVKDLFLVLDGPRARAFASSGAFAGGAADGKLVPVFAGVEDAEAVGALLRNAPAPLQDAA